MELARGTQKGPWIGGFLPRQKEPLASLERVMWPCVLSSPKDCQNVVLKTFSLSWMLWWFSRYVRSDSCEPMGCGPPSSSVHGILQARILEWVAIVTSLHDNPLHLLAPLLSHQFISRSLITALQPGDKGCGYPGLGLRTCHSGHCQVLRPLTHLCHRQPLPR